MVGADLPGGGIGLLVGTTDIIGFEVCGESFDFRDDALVAFDRRHLSAGIAFEQGEAFLAAREGVGSDDGPLRFFRGGNSELGTLRILAGVVLDSRVGRGDSRRGLRVGLDSRGCCLRFCLRHIHITQQPKSR